MWSSCECRVTARNMLIQKVIWLDSLGINSERTPPASLESSGLTATWGRRDGISAPQRVNRGHPAAQFDSIIQEFVSALRREGVADGYISRHPGPARQSPTWLIRRDIPLRTIDSTVPDCLLQHDCGCCSGVPATVLLYPWRKRRSSPEVTQFVRFLERTGRIEQPGELDDNLRILDAFLERLRGDGFARETMRAYRSAGAGLIVWLHLSRNRLRDLKPEVLARFRRRFSNRYIPCVFSGQRTQSPGTCCGTEVRGFLRYLAETGHTDPVEPAPQQQAFPERLERFRTWLARQRGLSAASLHRHAFLVAAVLPALGCDPRAYDAARIRRPLFKHIERRSRTYGRRVAPAMRMSLRFLVSEGSVPATVAGMEMVGLAPLHSYRGFEALDPVLQACATGRSSCCWCA